MKNKKNIILSASFIIFLSMSMYNSNKEKLEVKTIEKLITDGNFKDAINKIEDSKDSNILGLYKNILEDFLNLLQDNNMKSKKEKFLEFREKYNKDIDEDIFHILKRDILNIEDSINNYYKDISNEKEKINNAISNAINNVENMINEFKNKYPDEDISEIESTYKNIKEINNINKDDLEPNNNENNSISNTNIGIGSTNAAKNSSQIVTVVSNGGSYGELLFWEKSSSGKWNEVDRVSARLGQNGLKNANQVYEMDKCTPTGIYTLREAFGINSNPGSGIKYRQLDGTEYWVDDENSQYYNTMQFGDSNGRWESAEKLTDYTGYYNYSLVIDYNRWPVVPGKSSAIFVHCDIGIYTYGCVAIPQQNLVNLLKRLDPSKNPVVILDFDYDTIYKNY